jgi:hypothetical protein
MSKGPSLEPNFVERPQYEPDHRPIYLERRQSGRIALRLAFDVYDRSRYLGRYWSRDVSYDGLFLEADDAEPLEHTILNLHFTAEGMERCLQGIAVRAVRGEGIGVQLAVWRAADRTAYTAFQRAISAERLAPLAG